MKEKVSINSELHQAFENMHIADIGIFVVHLTYMTNLDPVSRTDLNRNILLSKCYQDVWDLL